MRQYGSSIDDPVNNMSAPASSDPYVLSHPRYQIPQYSYPSQTIYSQAQPGHCLAPAHTIFKAMSKAIPQIRVPKRNVLDVRPSHMDGIQIIARDDELWSPTRAIVIERNREENLGHDNSLDFEFCSIIRVKVDEGSEEWRFTMRGRHDGAELHYLICSVIPQSYESTMRSSFAKTSISFCFPRRSFRDVN